MRSIPKDSMLAAVVLGGSLLTAMNAHADGYAAATNNIKNGFVSLVCVIVGLHSMRAGIAAPWASVPRRNSPTARVGLVLIVAPRRAGRAARVLDLHQRGDPSDGCRDRCGRRWRSAPVPPRAVTARSRL
jgi:hypothetical protein